jgi:hypothetical protein
MFGLDCNRLAVAGNCLVITFQRVKYLSKATERLDIIGIDVERPLKAADRPLVALDRAKRGTEPATRLGASKVSRSKRK